MAENMGKIVIYEQKGKPIEVRLDGDTVWLTQRQMSELLDTSTDNIGLHIKKIYEGEELIEDATTEDSSVVQTEGKRSISRKIKHYNAALTLLIAESAPEQKDTMTRLVMNMLVHNVAASE